MAEQSGKTTTPAQGKKPVAPVPTAVGSGVKRPRKEYAPLDFKQIEATPADTREILVKHRNTKGERGAEQEGIRRMR